MKTAQLIDQAKARCDIPSDYAMAKRLGVTRQMVSGWRVGDKYPGTGYLFDLAEMAGIPPAQAIAEIELERDTRAGHIDQADSWRSRLQRLTGAAATAAMVGLMTTAPTPSNAAMTRANADAPPSVYYVNKRRRRTWLESLFPPPSLQLA